MGGVDYNLHQPKHINPIPGDGLIEAWKQDYATMQEQMIYGYSPSFDKMLASIKELVRRINALDWVIKGEFNNKV